MRHGTVLVGALVLGFVGGCLGALLVAGPTATSSSGDADGAETAAALERLQARVEALASAPRANRTSEGATRTPAPGVEAPRLAGAGTSPGGAGDAPHPVAPGLEGGADAPTVADLVRTLDRRVAVLERGGRAGTFVPEDLSKLTPPEMEALLRNLQAEKRYEEALRIADEYARRGDLTADQRADAELNAGYSLRSLGKHAEAETRFRETLARVGEQTGKGAEVSFQIAWERCFQNDLVGASNEMEKVANHPESSAILRAHGLYNAGTFANRSGDPARARDLLERLLRDHAADIPSSQQSMKTEAERILKELEGR